MSIRLSVARPAPAHRATSGRRSLREEGRLPHWLVAFGCLLPTNQPMSTHPLAKVERAEGIVKRHTFVLVGQRQF